MSEEGVEKYKQTHDSPTEWRLRKLFLEAHKDKFEERRLLCLASVFLNIEVYSAKYPEPVMMQLQGLMEEIQTEIAEAREGTL